MNKQQKFCLTMIQNGEPQQVLVNHGGLKVVNERARVMVDNNTCESSSKHGGSQSLTRVNYTAKIRLTVDPGELSSKKSGSWLQFVN